MCRRLVSALYQVKVELNKADDKEMRVRQPFRDFVPGQFVVLFGVKQLAFKNLCARAALAAASWNSQRPAGA